MIHLLTFLVCFILGELLKLIFKNMNKQYLPFIMAVVGMIFNPLVQWDFTLQTISIGLISGFASSGGYDAVKAIKQKYNSLT